MRELDQRMRRRLRELGQSERSPLGPVERQRIIARLGELEPRARGGVLPWLALAAAAALVAVWVASPPGDRRWADPTVADPVTDPRVEPLPEAVAARTPGPDARRTERTPPARPCGGAPVPAPGRPTARGSGARAIDLGHRARFVLFGDAEGRFETLEACRTIFALSRGRVLVHAEDLRGGELVVRTPTADVVVHGTVFDVRYDSEADGIRVAVAEGEVGVVDPAGREAARLAAGHTLSLDDAGAASGLLPEGAADALLRALEDRPPRPRHRAHHEVEAARPPPRGEVTGGVPQVHQPRWTSDP